MDSKEDLKEARALLKMVRVVFSDPKRFCKLTNARDKDQTPCSVANGASWCIRGALRLVANVCTSSERPPLTTVKMSWAIAFHALENSTSPLSMVTFNDVPDTTSEDILHAVNKAIAKIEADLAFQGCS